MATKNSKKTKRDVSGIFLLNKPIGYSSNSALQAVKRLFSAQKAGHTGSLDPLATGLLPICLGEATKYTQFLLDSDKKYEFTMRLGQVSSTGDSEGEIIATNAVPHLTIPEIEAILDKFKGNIEQIPPMYSALKHNGQPLYKMARKGIDIARPPRSITIHDLVCNGFSSPDIKLTVSCSKGTYVRSLAEDIGKEIGCGAHVVKLHRISVGTLTGEHMISLTSLEEKAKTHAQDVDKLDAELINIETMLADLPKHKVLAHGTKKLMLGQKITAPIGLPESTPICVLGYKGDFIGIAQVTDNHLVPRRMKKNQKP